VGFLAGEATQGELQGEFIRTSLMATTAENDINKYSMYSLCLFFSIINFLLLTVAAAVCYCVIISLV